LTVILAIPPIILGLVLILIGFPIFEFGPIIAVFLVRLFGALLVAIRIFIVIKEIVKLLVH
jgi:hypothetical protein